VRVCARVREPPLGLTCVSMCRCMSVCVCACARELWSSLCSRTHVCTLDACELQRVVVCCDVVQCVAVCRNVWQCVVVYVLFMHAPID